MIPDLEHLNYKEHEVEAKGKGKLKTWLITENENLTPRSPEQKGKQSALRSAAKKDTGLKEKVVNESKKHMSKD